VFSRHLECTQPKEKEETIISRHKRKVIAEKIFMRMELRTTTYCDIVMNEE
jgi:hypothetical protein